MSIIQHNRTIAPGISRMVRLNTQLPSIELWFGDATELPQYPTAEPVSHFLASSTDPATTFVGSKAINAALKSTLGILPPATSIDFRPPMDGAVFDISALYPGKFDRCLWFDPTFAPLAAAQAAPYRTDDIFRVVQAFAGHISCSVTIPVTVDTGNIAASTVMLQSLVHSALKYAAWNDCILTQIRIVMDTQDSAFTSAFDTLADLHDKLQDASANVPMPPSYGQGWPGYVNEGNNWIAANYPTAAFPDPLSNRQVFAIYIYTSNYFHAIQDALIQTDPNLPKTGDGVGFTDLTNPNYFHLIPLYAALSSGLMNIPAFRGTVHRGGDTSWNPFTPGGTIRFNNYVSSASEYYDEKLNPWPYDTPPPWDNSSHLRLQSQSARNIAPYSKHHYEFEHLFDHGSVMYISAHITDPGDGKEGKEVIAGNEVPRTVMPLLK